MENGPFIDDFPIKTPIYKGFSMAMLNNQMVYGKILFKNGWWTEVPLFMETQKYVYYCIFKVYWYF